MWAEDMPYYDSNIEFTPYMTPYIADGSGIGIVICPGGAYAARAERLMLR